MKSSEIRKSNLKQGQVVFYFKPPTLTECGMDIYGKTGTIQELTFDGIDRNVVYFTRKVFTGLKLYGSITGLLYNTAEEAEKARLDQLSKLIDTATANVEKRLKELQKFKEHVDTRVNGEVA